LIIKNRGSLVVLFVAKLASFARVAEGRSSVCFVSYPPPDASADDIFTFLELMTYWSPERPSGFWLLATIVKLQASSFNF
jgi:hypothetical protein